MNYLTLLVLAYLAALLWFGIRGGTRERELNAFLTAGGSAGALLCAFSLVSTIIGGSATLGMGALAQKVGPAAFWWLGVGAIGLFLHGLIIAPVVRKLPVVTLPDVLRHLAGPAAEKWAGAIIALSWAAVTAAQFTALRALLHSISGGMTAEVLYVLLAAGIVLHTALGGQRGILRADFLHTILLLGGFSAAALWCVMERSADIAALPVMPFTETFGLGDWVKMMLLVGITYLIGPDMFSRTFAAKNAQTACRAAWTAAPLLVFFGVIVTMLALLNIKAEQPISEARSRPLRPQRFPWGLSVRLPARPIRFCSPRPASLRRTSLAAPVHAPCVSGLQPSAFWPHWPLIPRETSSVGSSKATRSSSRALPCRSSSSSPAAPDTRIPSSGLLEPPRAVWEGLSAALPASPSGLTAASLLPPFLRSLPYGAPPKPAERPPRHRFSPSHKSEALMSSSGFLELDPDTQILYAYGQFFRSAASFYPTKPGAAPLHLRY